LNCVEPGYIVLSRTFVMNSLKQRYTTMKHKLQELFCLCVYTIATRLREVADMWNIDGVHFSAVVTDN